MCREAETVTDANDSNLAMSIFFILSFFSLVKLILMVIVVLLADAVLIHTWISKRRIFSYSMLWLWTCELFCWKLLFCRSYLLLLYQKTFSLRERPYWQIIHSCLADNPKYWWRHLKKIGNSLGSPNGYYLTF